jgi:toxin ParE1/3/4
MAEYRLSPAAENDLENIWRYTKKEWGDTQADHYLDLLTNAFATLSAAPKTAPACDYIRAGYRHQQVERHTVYFRIMDYGIAIIRILHVRMDAPRHL